MLLSNFSYAIKTQLGLYLYCVRVASMRGKDLFNEILSVPAHLSPITV